ncbi:chlorite dismutase family protein [Caenimonas sedimenti]|uniref:Chlorite dismutase family protein n=1 Tax=Caenimonas sedimenti TaxID=2596921 RepID=A0A562ZEX8_9BURK|nr:chlorite dismutase family protein [Caenimonas sedimenti]TWO66005.1 chlorite dismutase family protein [Caenimonas sedimenti]
MPAPLLVTFAANDTGPWRIDRVDTVTGEGMAAARRLAVFESQAPSASEGEAWRLSGTTSNLRYTHRPEVQALTAIQEGLGRRQATRAALIPIRKSEAWWNLSQDERRACLEEQSHHIALGLEYLPAVARRLHHCRDLGGPFDFLTWFEYAPEDEGRFESLVRSLRGTPEWKYVDREVDIRLTRD